MGADKVPDELDFLRLKVYGDFTIMSAIIALVAIFFVLWLFNKLRAVMRSQTPGAYQARMRCPECQWVGIVAELKPLCKKCGNTVLRHVRDL